MERHVGRRPRGRPRHPKRPPRRPSVRQHRRPIAAPRRRVTRSLNGVSLCPLLLARPPPYPFSPNNPSQPPPPEPHALAPRGRRTLARRAERSVRDRPASQDCARAQFDAPLGRSTADVVREGCGRVDATRSLHVATDATCRMEPTDHGCRECRRPPRPAFGHIPTACCVPKQRPPSEKRIPE